MITIGTRDRYCIRSILYLYPKSKFEHFEIDVWLFCSKCTLIIAYTKPHKNNDFGRTSVETCASEIYPDTNKDNEFLNYLG